MPSQMLNVIEAPELARRTARSTTTLRIAVLRSKTGTEGDGVVIERFLARKLRRVGGVQPARGLPRRLFAAREKALNHHAFRL